MRGKLTRHRYCSFSWLHSHAAMCGTAKLGLGWIYAANQSVQARSNQNNTPDGNPRSCSSSMATGPFNARTRVLGPAKPQATKRLWLIRTRVCTYAPLNRDDLPPPVCTVAPTKCTAPAVPSRSPTLRAPFSCFGELAVDTEDDPFQGQTSSTKK